MNFEKVQRKNRKAISPVLATVILIAITLIAAIAIAGFVFGLFGSFTSSAQVTATGTNFAAATWTTGAQTLSVANTGTASASIQTVSLTYGGQTCSPKMTTGLPAAVTAGAAITVTLAAQTSGCTTAPTSGEQFVGSLGMSNGASVSFTGSFL